MIKNFLLRLAKLAQNQKLNSNWEIPYNLVAKQSEATPNRLQIPYKKGAGGETRTLNGCPQDPKSCAYT